MCVGLSYEKVQETEHSCSRRLTAKPMKQVNSPPQ
jgi:hypothetical protein